MAEARGASHASLSGRSAPALYPLPVDRLFPSGWMIDLWIGTVLPRWWREPTPPLRVITFSRAAITGGGEGRLPTSRRRQPKLKTLSPDQACPHPVRGAVFPKISLTRHRAFRDGCQLRRNSSRARREASTFPSRCFPEDFRGPPTRCVRTGSCGGMQAHRAIARGRRRIPPIPPGPQPKPGDWSSKKPR